jgi:hypothetical protein
VTFLGKSLSRFLLDSQEWIKKEFAHSDHANYCEDPRSATSFLLVIPGNSKNAKQHFEINRADSKTVAKHERFCPHDRNGRKQNAPRSGCFVHREDVVT